MLTGADRDLPLARRRQSNAAQYRQSLCGRAPGQPILSSCALGVRAWDHKRHRCQYLLSRDDRQPRAGHDLPAPQRRPRFLQLFYVFFRREQRCLLRSRDPLGALPRHHQRNQRHHLLPQCAVYPCTDRHLPLQIQPPLTGFRSERQKASLYIDIFHGR